MPAPSVSTRYSTTLALVLRDTVKSTVDIFLLYTLLLLPPFFRSHVTHSSVHLAPAGRRDGGLRLRDGERPGEHGDHVVVVGMRGKGRHSVCTHVLSRRPRDTKDNEGLVLLREPIAGVLPRRRVRGAVHLRGVLHLQRGGDLLNLQRPGHVCNGVVVEDVGAAAAAAAAASERGDGGGVGGGVLAGVARHRGGEEGFEERPVSLTHAGLREGVHVCAIWRAVVFAGRLYLHGGAAAGDGEHPRRVVYAVVRRRRAAHHHLHGVGAHRLSWLSCYGKNKIGRVGRQEPGGGRRWQGWVCAHAEGTSFAARRHGRWETVEVCGHLLIVPCACGGAHQRAHHRQQTHDYDGCDSALAESLHVLFV